MELNIIYEEDNFSMEKTEITTPGIPYHTPGSTFQAGKKPELRMLL